MALLCVTPLYRELEKLCAGFGELGYDVVPHQIGRLDAYGVPALDLVLAKGGHGKTQFGIQSQYLLDHMPAVEAMLCIGSAGALAEDLAVGDIVIGSETVEHDYTQRFRSHPLPRFPADPALLVQLRSIAVADGGFQVHVGTIASGDEDVIEIERAAALRHATDACAVAWEGAGGARAAGFNAVPFVELRGISDTADHQALTSFVEHLPRVMRNLALFLAHWRSNGAPSAQRDTVVA